MNKVLILLFLIAPSTSFSMPPTSDTIITEVNHQHILDASIVATMHKRFTSIANKIGITEDEYLYAARTYLKLFSEENIAGLNKIQDRTLYQALTKNASDNENPSNYLKLNNDIKSDIASFIKLDVAKLDRFIEVIHSLNYAGEFEEIKINTQPNKEAESNISHVEEIISVAVVCDETCQQSAPSITLNPNASNIPMNIYIFNQVMSQGAVHHPGYAYTVNFIDKATGSTLSTELWSYNNWFGAYKIPSTQ